VYVLRRKINKRKIEPGAHDGAFFFLEVPITRFRAKTRKRLNLWRRAFDRKFKKKKEKEKERTQLFVDRVRIYNFAETDLQSKLQFSACMSADAYRLS